MKLVDKLNARAVASVERDLRAAIARLTDRITDIEIERYQLDFDGPRAAELSEERFDLQGHVNTLRMTIARHRSEGSVFLTSRDEEALRAASARRRPPRAEVPAPASSSTVTPAPAPMRALPGGRTPRARKPAPSTKSQQVVLLLGMGQRSDDET